MKVAIVTAYYKEPLELLLRCVDSVRQQIHPCTHILVADGHPRSEVDSWDVQHIQLPRSHGDYGDTPRFVGSVAAHAQGFDALCWLDADNWLEPNHVSSCLALASEHGVPIVTATRSLRRLDGSLLAAVDTESDGRNFCDTNCYLILRDAMLIGCEWGMKRVEGQIGDRAVWTTVEQFFPRRACNPVPTINYVTTFALNYVERGERPPNNAKLWVQFPGQAPRTVSYWKYLDLQAAGLVE